jgi:SAM-dependent methyltransferase
MSLQFGVDVAATRADDLDKKCLATVVEMVADGTEPTVLDVGAGSGGLAVRLATAGAVVTALDIADYQSEIEERNNALPADAQPIVYIQASIENWLQHHTSIYGSVVLQRMVHYLPYEAAKRVLRQLAAHSQQLFVSVTGVESDIGAAYPAAATPLPERWATLEPAAQKMFLISEPLCLYSAAEFRQLLETTGWKVTELWTSAFGNHKAVALSQISQER